MIMADDVGQMSDHERRLVFQREEERIVAFAARDAQTFPVDAIPKPYHSMVKAVAEACQVDPAMPAVSILSVLSAAAGGALRAEPRAGWCEPINLYTATVAMPGERKSAVQAELTAPLYDAEEQLAQESADERLEQDSLRKIAVQAAEKARRAAANAKAADRKRATEEALAETQAAEMIKVPPVTRLIADDITPEAAASLIAEQKRLAIISAEGGIFDTFAGRYNNNVPNLDLFLKGHSGDRLRVDRKGRDPEYVDCPALTVGLMVQPDVITAIGRRQQFRGRGLLARFLYAAPCSKIGSRKPDAAPVPDHVRSDYQAKVRDLVIDLASQVGKPGILTFTDEAQAKVVGLLTETEKELADGGALASIRDWGAKYVGAVIRIAGLLHLAQHGALGAEKPIQADTLADATEIGSYFKHQALRTFTTMQADPLVADMEYVIERVRQTGLDELSERDIFNETRSRFSITSNLKPVIAELIERGYLIPQEEPKTTGPGRRPSPRYRVDLQPAISAQFAEPTT